MTKNLAYAIGDIHGMSDMLDEMIVKITEHSSLQEDGRRLLITLGDYVDRGPDSCKVIERLMKGVDGFENINLKGNHEDLMEQAVVSKSTGDVMNWYNNGGTKTLDSYPVDDDGDAVIHKEHLSWIQNLPLYHQEEKFLFVHAGIRPGVPVEESDSNVLLWIRDAFLMSDVEHPHRVIHGHTPKSGPEVKHNRINVDTGACYGGDLTCVVLDLDAGLYDDFIVVKHARRS